MLLFVLRLFAELGGGDTEVLTDVLAEEGGVGETKLVANLLDAEVCLHQIIPYVLYDMLGNPFVGGLARVFLADGGEVFGRD